MSVRTVSITDFAPEFRLLLSCAIWPRSAEVAERTRAEAAAVTDWPRFMALVHRHRVAGLIHNAITTAGAELPSTIAQNLAEQSRANAVHEVVSVAETARLTQLMQVAGVEVAVLKGAAFALLAFGRYGLRYSMDIDLLVDKSDIEAASTALRQAGYVRTEPAEDASPAVMAARMGRYKDLVFEHPRTGLMIELHWRLFQNPFLMRHAGMRKLEPVALNAGVVVNTLPRQTAKLYLFTHGGEHAWARLKWLADVGALLGSDAREADTLYAAARSQGLRRWIGPGMLLSAELLGTPVPEALARDARRDWRMRWLLKTARDSLIGDQRGTELEAMPGATTRKNLGHYLSLNDPRYWVNEARYDLLDGSSGGDQTLTGRLLGRAKAVLGILGKTRARPMELS